MSDVTQILSSLEQGDLKAAEQLLPLVYEELRRLAARKLANESPGQTLQATALVHEAYLRLVGSDPGGHFQGRRHFFRAAAEAMRRILVDRARHKGAEKRGGGRGRAAMADVAAPDEGFDWLALDEALDELAREDPTAAELARLKLFAGLSIDEAAEVVGVSRATANRDWSYSRAWLRDALGD